VHVRMLLVAASVTKALSRVEVKVHALGYLLTKALDRVRWMAIVKVCTCRARRGGLNSG
jgi:hypothetical protein